MLRNRRYNTVVPAKAVLIIGDLRASDGDWPNGLRRNDVANLGIAGISSARLLSHLAGFSKKSVKQQVAILQVGINDLRDPEVKVDAVFDNLPRSSAHFVI